jgi:hypothetical protein
VRRAATVITVEFLKWNGSLRDKEDFDRVVSIAVPAPSKLVNHF